MWATNLKVLGIVVGTLALYTLIANSIPQVQSEVPQTLTLGASVTPELRRITEDGKPVSSAEALRIGVFASLDITIFPF